MHKTQGSDMERPKLHSAPLQRRGNGTYRLVQIPASSPATSDFKRLQVPISEIPCQLMAAGIAPAAA
ncbi:hypothetical protein CSOJ01_01619 [Colletotrichum sojae]|uniref:Uncharacterized protein n=1 Tax=Colletotrichum sojae TaxID=2175907 RepID=A0A8H6JTS2_9PEZI|nr:hypothetical protein CSOJ01_01619 [Colletotrichum sojae]